MWISKKYPEEVTENARKALADISPHGHVWFIGVGGSRAYGMEHADSDWDLTGCYGAHGAAFWKFTEPKQTFHVVGGPDYTVHEVKKHMRLAGGGNPTILESLFTDQHLWVSHWGRMYIEMAPQLLSQRVRDSYGGFITSQIKRLERDGMFEPKLRKRAAKHMRHCARLTEQCRTILETGNLKVRVRDPEAIATVGQMDKDEFIKYMRSEVEIIDTMPSDLREQPHYKELSRLLVDFRRAYLGA